MTDTWDSYSHANSRFIRQQKCRTIFDRTSMAFNKDYVLLGVLESLKEELKGTRVLLVLPNYL